MVAVRRSALLLRAPIRPSMPSFLRIAANSERRLAAPLIAIGFDDLALHQDPEWGGLLTGHFQPISSIAVETVGTVRRNVLAEALAALLALHLGQTGPGRPTDSRAIAAMSKLRQITGCSCVNRPLWPSVRPFFRQALDFTRAQGVLSWELRVATSLALLWKNQHRGPAGRRLLESFLRPLHADDS